MKKTSLSLTALLGLTLCQLQAAQTILVQDTSTTATILPGAFGGTTADTGQTWNGSGWNRQNGVINMTSERFYTLDIGLIMPNSIYRLGIDASVNVARGLNTINWMALGFKTPLTSSVDVADPAGMLFRAQTENGFGLFSQGGSIQELDSPGTTGSLSITLETGVTLTDSQVSWAFNGSPIGTTRQINAAGVDGIFLQSFGVARGTIDNVTLTVEPVPEPSSALLICLAGITTLVRRRR